MKNLQFLSILLAFIIFMPFALSSFYSFDICMNKTELYDNPFSETQSEDSGSKKEKESKAFEDFLFDSKSDLILFNQTQSISFSNLQICIKFESEVLTPPPEFIEVVQYN